MAPKPSAVELPEASDRYTLYAEYLLEAKGYDVDPAALQVAVQNYGAFQRSDVNKEYNSARIEENAEERAARQERSAEKKEAAEAKRVEREEKRAEREAAAIERAAKKSANAAKASAPAKKTTARPTATSNRPAAKKTTAKIAVARTSGKPRAARAASADKPF